MDMKLERTESRKEGIFGTLQDDSGNFLHYTLEHAYPSDDDWAPKIPTGTYNCKRSSHRLHGMTEDFETFEIMGVPGHTGLLFHWGNYNSDSEGCVLLGWSVSGTMITRSRDAFADFMKRQDGVDEFQLEVI